MYKLYSMGSYSAVAKIFSFVFFVYNITIF
jgi:hypothetical protein